MELNTQTSGFQAIFKDYKLRKKPVWIENMGGYDKLPTPYRELKDDEIGKVLKDLVIYEFEVEFRQVRIDKELYDVKVFWLSDKAYMFALTAWRKVRVFRLGCEHEEVKEIVKEHSIKWICKKCGFEWEADTSD